MTTTRGKGKAMGAGEAKIGSMEANISNLVRAVTDMDERAQKRDEASQSFREQVVGSLATINEKLETANQNQISNVEYQKVCDNDRKVQSAAIAAIKTQQEEHTKQIDDHDARLTAAETFVNKQKGAIIVATGAGGIIGGCFMFLADLFKEWHK